MSYLLYALVPYVFYVLSVLCLGCVEPSLDLLCFELVP